MEWLFLFVAVVIAAVLILKAKSATQANHGDSANVEEFPYRQASPLFTPAERSFLGVLDQAVAGRARVFGKVRVGDVLSPRKGLQRGVSSTARNKIDRKHFDFVLCDPNDLSVICVIELDDKSHQAKSRQDRDDFLLGACRAAGIPMIQVPAQASYSISNLADRLSEYLSLTSGNSIETHVTNIASMTLAETTCPKCSSGLVERVVKRGEHAGKKLLACAAFPSCRYYRSIRPESASK